MKLALFDFDGTLTQRDSFFVFLKKCFPTSKIISGAFILSPILLLYKLKLLNPDLAKQKVLKFFLKGVDKKSFAEKCNKFSEEEIPKMIFTEAEKCLREYEQNNFHIVIISASPEIYLSKWCALKNYQLISTKLKVENEKFTGEYEGKNCRGEEKLRRLNSEIDLSSYSEIHAFGDSEDDKPFMSVAQKQFFKTLLS